MSDVILTLVNGRLRISNNSALVISKSTAEPCCCEDCKICFYFSAYDGCRDTTLGNKKYQKTITVPARFKLPVKVVADGGVDDVFMLDGDGSVFGQNPALSGTGAHNFSYEWVQTNRTFTVEALDTYGACTGITYLICFMPIGAKTIPSQMKLCEPTTTLPGSDKTYTGE
jgi:hypothetical protein